MKKIFKLLFAAQFIFAVAFVPLLVSCNPYTSIGQMDKYNAKKDFKSCEGLKSPIFLFNNVWEHLYYGGNPESDFIMETRGGAFCVLDWESKSVFDWTFIPSLRGMAWMCSAGAGRYQVCSDWLYPCKKSYILDTYTGKVSTFDKFDTHNIFSYAGYDARHIPNGSKVIFHEKVEDSSERNFYVLKILNCENGTVQDLPFPDDYVLDYNDATLSSDGIFYKDDKAYILGLLTEDEQRKGIYAEVDLVNDKIINFSKTPLDVDIGEVADDYKL